MVSVRPVTSSEQPGRTTPFVNPLVGATGICRGCKTKKILTHQSYTTNYVYCSEFCRIKTERPT